MAGLLVAVFIYWGWDSTVCVNEETTDSGTTPGKAAIASTVILVGIYVLVAAAAVAFAGPEAIANDESGDALGLLGTDVLGKPLDKIVIIAVLTSAAASTQTTILPTARTSLSMARAKAMPESLGVIHPRYLTPHVSTILMGVFSIALVRRADARQREHPLRLDRRARADDRLLLRAHRLRVRVLLPPRAVQERQELPARRRRARARRADPLLRALKSIVDLSKPENSESGDSWLGVGPPLVIGIGLMLFGVVLMFIWYFAGHREFFQRKLEVADPGSLETAAAGQPAETAGVA